MGICNLINHGWTRIWFANAHRYYVMACAVMLGGLAIAAESISIIATPRYPWNGKVDLKFTIDAGDVGGGYADPQPGDELIAGRRLCYVQSAGNVHLNTGVTPGSRNVIEMKFEWEDNPSSANECLFCARGSTITTATYTGFLIGSTWRFDYNTEVGGESDAVALQKGVPYVIRDVAGKASVNGTVVRELPSASFTVGGPLTLFSSYVDTPGNSIENYLAGKVYYLKIFGDDGTTLLHDFAPWEQNGKIGLYDLVGKKFVSASTGTLSAGQKYATSFTAKDVAGGTNLTMKTLYKSNGAAANAAKEQLLPGTYNWVWDATADLTTRWPSYASCVPTSSAVLLKDAQLAAIAEFFAVPCGNAVADKSNRAKGRWIKTDGTGKSVQFAFSDDKYTKCVCVHFEQSGANVVGYVKWARYVTGLGRENEDFEANSATTQTIATSTTTDGYGLCKLEARIPQPDASVVLDRVVVEGKTDAPPNIKTATYMVIDLSGGSSAKSYPVSYLGAVPSGGWSDEYKKTKLVLRHCEAGSYNMLGKYSVKLTKSFYIGIFEVTQGQYKQITGGNPSYYKGDKRPVEMLSFEDVVGSSYGFGDGWPKSSNVGSSTCLGKLRSRTGLKFFLPTEAQWEYACRAGTTSSYNNGGSSSSDKLKVGRCYSNQSDGKSGYSSRHTSVGSYLANSWGIYDMHGNVYEWCLDIDNGKAPTGGTDPKGPTSPGYSWYRVLRGGDWGEGNSVTSNSRTIEYPAYENIAAYDNSEGYGFRICLTLE